MMINKSKISVVVTCHNYGKFLRECLNSLIQQSRVPDQVIVVNDSSSDETEEIVREFQGIEYFFVKYKNAQKSRNFGLRKSQGDLILFLDADDYLALTCIEKMENVLLMDDDIDLVYSHRMNFGNDEILRQGNFKKEWESHEYDYEKLKRQNYISLPSLLRKENFQGFDESINRFQDWDAWLSFLNESNAKLIPEHLFHVRFHGHNKTFKESEFNERLKVLKKHSLCDAMASDLMYQQRIIHNLISQKKGLNAYREKLDKYVILPLTKIKKKMHQWGKINVYRRTQSIRVRLGGYFKKTKKKSGCPSVYNYLK